DPTGPTAHSAPLQPLLLSLLFKVVGTGSRGAVAMTVLGCVQASLGFALLPLLGVTSGLGLHRGVLAGIFCAPFPVNYWSQTNGGFEGATTATILILLCIMVCRAWRSNNFTRQEGVQFGVVAGVGCLTSPVLIPVLASWIGISGVRYRQDLRRIIGFF